MFKGSLQSYTALYHLYYREPQKLRSFQKAFFLNLIAADQGKALAQKYLGQLYEKGEGIEENKIQAAKWYILAACQGSDDRVTGQKQLDSLRVQMTDKELLEASKLADEWVQIKVNRSHFLGKKRQP